MLPLIESGQILIDSLRFMPELLICLGIVVLLVLRLIPAFDRMHLGVVALLFALAALGASVMQWLGEGGREGPDLARAKFMFGDVNGGLLVYDHFTVFVRCFLYGFAALILWLSLLTRIPDRQDSAHFGVLLLGPTPGMAIMGMAHHLLMVFIGVEMASLPSYGLAGFLKGRRQSSEAALKYVVYGGGASGVMLYGISLLAGKFGTGYLPDLALAFASAVRP